MAGVANGSRPLGGTGGRAPPDPARQLHTPASLLEAHQADEAIRIFEEHDGQVHLLLTDVIMPGMSGPQLAGELVGRDPQLRVVFMSGYPNEELIGEHRSFLQKPFNPAGLSQAIRKELDRPVVRKAH